MSDGPPCRFESDKERGGEPSNDGRSDERWGHISEIQRRDEAQGVRKDREATGNRRQRFGVATERSSRISNAG